MILLFLTVRAMIFFFLLPGLVINFIKTIIADKIQ